MKLNYIGTETEGYTSASFLDFLHWIEDKKLLGFDVESNVTSSILDRYLITLQFSDKEQVWVIQWSYLQPIQQEAIKVILNLSHIKLIIHSGTFESTLLQNYGVILKNIWDTYRVEQILNTGRGAEQSSFNLESVMFKRFEITMDKSQQLLFGDDIMTPEKILYAAADVSKSIHLYEIQLDELRQFDKNFKQTRHRGLVKTAWWENEFTLVAADLEYQGVLIDQEKWKDCYNKSYPAMMEAKAKLDSIVIEEFNDFATEQDWLSDVDRFESIWGSTEKKREILQLVFPDITSVTKLGLKEYLRDNDPDFPLVEENKKSVRVLEGLETDKIVTQYRKLKITGKEWENHEYKDDFTDSKYTLIKMLIIANHDFTIALNNFFYKNFQEFMLEHNYVIPANTLSINWASSSQKLLLFKYISPSIEDTTALTVEGNLLTHKLFQEYEAYQESAQLVSKFGIDYLKHVEADGRIRTRFNTVLSTGRISSISPNLLQLPHNQDYRACFVAPEGFKFIGSDFESEELVVLAVLAKEKMWLEALENHWDIHSINAEFLYEQDWIDATEPGCTYVSHKQKCKCKGHKEMRTSSKQLSFGVVYGISAYGFAARTHKTEKESERLINKFYEKLIYIKSFLTNCGNFGVKYKFIYEVGTGRIRFFDDWKVAKRKDSTGKWIFVNEEEMRGVMRASQNFPIQSTSASILKIACVLIRRWLINNNLRKHIQLVLPVHDENLMYAREGYEQLAKEKLEYFMRLAGKLILKNDLLRATATISEFWVKD